MGKPQPELTPGMKKFRAWAMLVIVLLFGGCTVAMIATTDSGSPVTAGTPTTDAPVQADIPAPQTTALSTSGNGIKNTASFNGTGHWRIDYTFDCHDFGQAGNFIIDVLDGQGNEVDAAANALAVRGSDTTYETYVGTASLKVNSECAWTVNVVVN